MRQQQCSLSQKPHPRHIAADQTDPDETKYKAPNETTKAAIASIICKKPSVSQMLLNSNK